MYRYNPELELFLVHPGGPFFRNRDEGIWTIPKGLIEEDEDGLEAAKREFREETGLEPLGPFAGLDSIRQKGGKTVHAWAFRGDVPDSYEPVSNTFELEWPPRSGIKKDFPEIDRALFFTVGEAVKKINHAQILFIERLRERGPG